MIADTFPRAPAKCRAKGIQQPGQSAGACRVRGQKSLGPERYPKGLFQQLRRRLLRPGKVRSACRQAAKQTLLENPELRDEIERKVRECFEIPIIERSSADAEAVTPVAKPTKKK